MISKLSKFMMLEERIVLCGDGIDNSLESISKLLKEDLSPQDKIEKIKELCEYYENEQNVGILYPYMRDILFGCAENHKPRERGENFKMLTQIVNDIYIDISSMGNSVQDKNAKNDIANISNYLENFLQCKEDFFYLVDEKFFYDVEESIKTTFMQDFQRQVDDNQGNAVQAISKIFDNYIKCESNQFEFFSILTKDKQLLSETLIDSIQERIQPAIEYLLTLTNDNDDKLELMISCGIIGNVNKNDDVDIFTDVISKNLLQSLVSISQNINDSFLEDVFIFPSSRVFIKKESCKTILAIKSQYLEKCMLHLHEYNKSSATYFASSEFSQSLEMSPETTSETFLPPSLMKTAIPLKNINNLPETIGSVVGKSFEVKKELNATLTHDTHNSENLHDKLDVNNNSKCQIQNNYKDCKNDHMAFSHFSRKSRYLQQIINEPLSIKKINFKIKVPTYF